MVELRKRPAPAAAAPPAKKKAMAKPAASKAKPAPKGKKAAAEEAEAATEEAEDVPMAEEEAPATEPVAPKVAKGTVAKKGETIELDGFGGEVETHDGKKVTLAQLVEESDAGVVLFTYPKASTPGCIKQACLFRDSYEPLTATGLSIYGLSADSPKSNTNFKTKQNLPYPLLCDPAQTLIGAIGFKKAAKSTQRGVFVVDKHGKVLAAEDGGPAPTVEVVKKVVESMGGSGSADGIKKAEATAAGEADKEGDDKMVADTADEVADTAEKIDGEI